MKKEETTKTELDQNTTPCSPVGFVKMDTGKHAINIGGDITKMLSSDIEDAKLSLLLAKNNSEYYSVETRKIVDVDDLVELLVKFKTDLPVAVQYQDMILNDVATISIMPNVNGEGAYISIMDINELQLGIIDPKSELFTLYIKDVNVEDDLMVFATIDILYHDTPNMQYPYFWLDHEIVDGEDNYTVKCKLNPLIHEPITAVESFEGNKLSLEDLCKITERLNDSNDVLFLPYSGILVNDNYECYKLINMGDLFLDVYNVDDEDIIYTAIPYTEFMNLEKDYTFKHYIDKGAITVKITNDGEDMKIINAPFEDESINFNLLTLISTHYDRLIADDLTEAEVTAIIEELPCGGVIIVDSPNEQILLIRKSENKVVRVI